MPTDLKTAAADALVTAVEQNGRLRSLLNRVMIGGNHLATHIDMDGPTWRAPHDEALEHYGAGLPYDTWCCWKTIMAVREDLENVG